MQNLGNTVFRVVFAEDLRRIPPQYVLKVSAHSILGYLIDQSTGVLLYPLRILLYISDMFSGQRVFVSAPHSFERIAPSSVSKVSTPLLSVRASNFALSHWYAPKKDFDLSNLL